MRKSSYCSMRDSGNCSPVRSSQILWSTSTAIPLHFRVGPQVLHRDILLVGIQMLLLLCNHSAMKYAGHHIPVLLSVLDLQLGKLVKHRDMLSFVQLHRNIYVTHQHGRSCIACHSRNACFAQLQTDLLLHSRLSITAMLFCCVCALCVGQLVAVSLGQKVTWDLSCVLTVPSSIVSLVRLGCKNSSLSEASLLP